MKTMLFCPSSFTVAPPDPTVVDSDGAPSAPLQALTAATAAALPPATASSRLGSTTKDTLDVPHRMSFPPSVCFSSYAEASGATRAPASTTHDIQPILDMAAPARTFPALDRNGRIGQPF